MATIYEFLHILDSGFKCSASFWEVSHNLQLLNSSFFSFLQLLFLMDQYLVYRSDPFFFSVHTEALFIFNYPFLKSPLTQRLCCIYMKPMKLVGQRAKRHSTWWHFGARTRDPDSSAARQHPTESQSLSGIKSFHHKGLEDRESQGGKSFPPASLYLTLAPLPHISGSLRVLTDTAVISAWRMQQAQQDPCWPWHQNQGYCPKGFLLP